MYIHDLKSPPGSRKKRKIVGRGPGSGHGKTSCRGQKGQNARSGRGILLGLEGGQVPLIRRLPKVGFNPRRSVLNQVVNVENLNRFDQGTVVTGELLKTQGFIKSLHKPYKILANGEIKKTLTLQVPSISKQAREKIIKAGGKVEIVQLKSEEAAASKKK